MENNNIIHITVNDWDDEFESEVANEFLEKLSDPKSDYVCPFNYSMTILDMAQFFFITTTEEDLKKHNLTELLKNINSEKHLRNPNAMFTINMFPPYDLSKIGTPANGRYIDVDRLYYPLWVFVDEDGDAHMTNSRVAKIDEYFEIAKKNNRRDMVKMTAAYEEYQKNKRNNNPAPGWISYYDEEKGFCLPADIIDLPLGFIEQNLHKKMTFDDSPELWKATDTIKFNFFDE